MPRTNQFFDNLSETPILSESEAIEVLEAYCGENNVSIYDLPNSAIDNFIETVRYAPIDISPVEIARRIGIHPRRPRRPTFSAPYFTYSDVVSDTDMRVAQASNGTGRSIQRNIDFQELLAQTEHQILTQAVEPVRIDSVEEIVSSSREVDDFDELLAEMPSLTWTAVRSNRSPKQKKRKRSEKDMMMEIVRGEQFPRPNFKEFSSNRELEDIMHNWYGNVEYREQWIFSRREREGFNRRNIGFFSLDDVMARMSKRKRPHQLDTETSKFYDWKLGGTEWILRLELYQHEQTYFLITHHIHVPTDTEVKFDVRYWNQEQFKTINAVWCQQKNNDVQFDRVFGSNDENSPYYTIPYQEDDYEEDYDDDYDNDCEECESGDW